jgi:hypothetical protein
MIALKHKLDKYYLSISIYSRTRFSNLETIARVRIPISADLFSNPYLP